MSNPLHGWSEQGPRWLRKVIDTPLRRMLGRHHQLKHQPGAGPGELFIAPDAAATVIRLFHLPDTGELRIIDVAQLDDIRDALAGGGRLWLDVTGFADEAKLRELATMFDLHSMALADMVNVERQFTVDVQERHGVVVTQVMHATAESDQPALIQLGLVLGASFLISFRERPGALFDPIVTRIQRTTSRLRSEGLDYLAQALLDVVVDAGFPVVEMLADRVDALEERLLDPKIEVPILEIHGQRRALITLARLLWRQRDLMARLLREDQLFRPETRVYLRDLHDRTVQLLDMIETTRDLAASLVEIHLSISANRSNQIMKMLTVIASIFIPLTFIAGVYGMNFKFMPELQWQYGYPLVISIMLVVALGLLAWFYRLGWLKRDEE